MTSQPPGSSPDKPRSDAPVAADVSEYAPCHDVRKIRRNRAAKVDSIPVTTGIARTVHRLVDGVAERRRILGLFDWNGNRTRSDVGGTIDGNRRTTRVFRNRCERVSFTMLIRCPTATAEALNCAVTLMAFTIAPII